MGLVFSETDLHAEGKVKIGILHSLSGTMAISETSLRDVVLMAVEEINAAGGVLGGTVTVEGSGSPLAGISVRLLSPGNVLEAVTSTAVDGSYSFSAPAVGDHLVRFIDLDGSHVGEFNVDAPNRFTATPVTVT